MKCWKSAAAGLLLALTAWATQAAPVIEFAPRNQTVLLGDEATVDIVVSDTGGLLIGVHDFFVNFNTSILSLADVVLGTALGGPGDVLEDVVPGPGRVNVAVVSLLTDLTAFQTGTDSFVLFSLTFRTTAVGTSVLSFGENILGFAGGFLGDELGLGVQGVRTQAGSITVISPNQGGSVPEPATAGLVLLAALGALSASRRRSRASR